MPMNAPGEQALNQARTFEIVLNVVLNVSKVTNIRAYNPHSLLSKQSRKYVNTSSKIYVYNDSFPGDILE